MLLISKYLIWLVVYAVLGWVWESAYCTITEKKWANRGFLYGPLCPIYGFGAIFMILGWMLTRNAGLNPSPVVVFVVVALGSAVLEYVTSWALEALFHARWWDYSDMPLNLNGRICLPASLLFGAMGLLMCYVLYDPTISITESFALWVIELVALLLMCAVSIDTTLTVNALTTFAQTCDNIANSVNDHMDAFVDGHVESSATKREEREFEKAERKKRLAEMGGSVRSAAGRIVRVMPEKNTRRGEEFKQLISDLRERREAKKAEKATEKE